AETRALFAGMSAHANVPLDARFSASFGLVLGAAAHAVGWPVAAGGSEAIAKALVRYLEALGGEVRTGERVESVRELGDPDAVLFDLTPRQVVRIAGERFSDSYRRRLKAFRYG